LIKIHPITVTFKTHFSKDKTVMDILLIISGSLLMILGIAGCLLPILPGPPLSYLGLIAIHLTSKIDFSSKFLISWGIIVILVSILDYVIPIWGTKFFGGSKYGVWGSMIGLLAGLFIPPIGIIIGPFIGAVAGEMLAGNKQNALKAGFGSFIGFIAGTVVKMLVSLIMLYYFIAALI
jgi:uncharacterized protein YqgC (DUF456 family)